MVRLHDLEELVLSVRNDTSKVYIREAINAYRGGANRAAIISIWIAVSYDIISKIREVAEQGDKEAKNEINEFERLIKSSQSNKEQIKKLQEFENSLLNIANDKYEFINKTEYEYLTRIKSDRNISAHPAFIDNEALFQPTGELVKSHIVHAIEYLLQHRPIQGKAAFDKIIRDIKRSSFPSDLETAKKYLNKQYFSNSKPVLIKNVTIGLLKGLLNGDVINDGNELNVINTLLSIADSNPKIYEEQLKYKLVKIIDRLEDKQLWNVLTFIKEDTSSWKSLDEPTKIRITEFLKLEIQKGSELLNKYAFVTSINIPELHPIVDELNKKVEGLVNNEINAYGESGSYAGAYERGKTHILPYIPYFNEKNIENFIAVIINNTNNQIIPAAGSDQIFEAVFNGTINMFSDTKKFWKKLLPHLGDEDGHYEKIIKKIKTTVGNNS